MDTTFIVLLLLVALFSGIGEMRRASINDQKRTAEALRSNPQYVSSQFHDRIVLAVSMIGLFAIIIGGFVLAAYFHSY